MVLNVSKFWHIHIVCS